MTTTVVRLPLSASLFAAGKARLATLPHAWRALAAAVVLALLVNQAIEAAETPAQSLRRELAAAAEATGALPWNRTPDQVRSAVGAPFSGQAVSVDPRRFPAEVFVAVDGVDRVTCVEAAALARRIEGSVVVALEGFASAADCRDGNRMVWRIMP